METIQRSENPVTKFQPSIETLDAYLDLFDRLSRVLDQADEVERESWDEHWCRQILSELKTEFARVKLPERKTIWQMMLVEQCLQPLWDRITVNDLTAIDHEVSRVASFSKRVVHIGYVVYYWQHLLQCQRAVLERARRCGDQEGIDVVVPLVEAEPEGRQEPDKRIAN